MKNAPGAITEVGTRQSRPNCNCRVFGFHASIAARRLLRGSTWTNTWQSVAGTRRPFIAISVARGEKLMIFLLNHLFVVFFS